MEFSFDFPSYQSFRQKINNANISILRFKLCTYKTLMHKTDSIEVLNSFHKFLDGKLRNAGQSLVFYIEESDFFITCVRGHRTLSPFYNCLNNSMSMINVLYWQKEMVDPICNIFLWDGLDREMAYEIQHATLNHNMKSFLVVNTFSEEVYEKDFYKQFFREDEFDDYLDF